MDWLLSDEFVEFSKKVAEIYTEKKRLKQEMQELYKSLQAQAKLLDDEAAILQEEFEEWKSSGIKKA